MSAKGFEKRGFELVDLSLADIFPQYDQTQKAGDAQSFDIFYEMIKQVLPKFDRVEFILAEILELESSKGRATTHVYSRFDEETNGALIDSYFEIIDGIRESRGWSLSKLDNLYFKQQIWCIHVHSDERVNNNAGTVGSRWWHDPTREKTLDLRSDDHVERGEEEIEEMLNDYITKLFDLCLSPYAHSYVLLIPIALNALKEEDKNKAKLGAIFLHFSSCEQISKEDLRRIYGRVLLFWHYYFTSELLGKRQLEIEQSQRKLEKLEAAQELYTSAQQHMNDILNKLHDLQKPVLNLEMTLSPVCGLIYGGQSLERFFQPGGRPVQVNGHTIEALHAWSHEGKTPEGLKKYQDVTAAVLLKLLGCADSTMPQQSLWQHLYAWINQGVSGSKRLVLKALVEYIPALSHENPEPDEIENAFKLVKLWFNDAYKEHPHHASLPYSFLALALRSMNCDFKYEESLSRGDSFWVASRRPVETLDALAVLHNMYAIKQAALIIEKGREHQLDIMVERPHNVNEGDAERIEESLENVLNALGRRDVPRQGDMTYVLSKLFGDKKVAREGTVFRWEDTRPESVRCHASMGFHGDGDNRNKISMKWVGRVFS